MSDTTTKQALDIEAIRARHEDAMQRVDQSDYRSMRWSDINDSLDDIPALLERVAELEQIVERFQMSAGITVNYLQRCEPSELRDGLLEALSADLELAMGKDDGEG